MSRAASLQVATWVAGSVTILLLVLTAVSKPAGAATTLNNGGFETGDLSGWSVAPGGYASAVTNYSSYGAQEGSYFALLTPGQVAVDTMISQPFSAAPGDKVSGWAFFKSEEGSSYYNDTGKVLIRSSSTGAVVATVFQSSVSSVGSYGGTPWTPWEYAFTESGTFIIEARVANQGDSSVPSRIGLDDVKTYPTVDTIPPSSPTLDLDAGSDTGKLDNDNVTKNATPTFTGNAEFASNVEIFADGTSIGSATTGPNGKWTFTLGTALNDGTYSIKATATDAAGNTSDQSTALEVLIDTASPNVAFDSSGPSETALSNTASFSFSSEAGATLACKLDEEPDFVACASPKEYTNLTNGSHTFSVKATDEAGNTGEASRTWTVDTTLPNATITSGPSGSVRSTSARFLFSSEGSSFRCSLDGGPYEECYSPKSYFGLHDGVHLLRVKATDVPGNNTPVEREWVVDTAAPDTAITSGPSGAVNSGTASFAFSFAEEDATEEGSTFQCSLDGAPFVACASPKSYTALADGSHTFSVRAVDPAGNKDSTPATRTWTADTVLPTVSGMTPANASKTKDNTPTIKATVRDNRTNLQKANIKLYINGVLISPTKYSYSASTDELVYNSPRIAKGKKTVRVVATDAAKNVRSTSWYFTIK